eukprot:GHVU01066214.1.p1 GENE.GHVU01066214.1~~GHVU01066214.1.p1  ORF type:complete len:175 (+),score=23.13 GHVU01066214.1:1895-2419(+)
MTLPVVDEERDSASPPAACAKVQITLLVGPLTELLGTPRMCRATRPFHAALFGAPAVAKLTKESSPPADGGARGATCSSESPLSRLVRTHLRPRAAVHAETIKFWNLPALLRLRFRMRVLQAFELHGLEPESRGVGEEGAQLMEKEDSDGAAEKRAADMEAAATPVLSFSLPSS